MCFYHTHAPFSDPWLINVPYCKLHFDADKDFIISPPALSLSSFEEKAAKKYLLSFKGDLGFGPNRSFRRNTLKEIINLEIRDSLIVDRDHEIDYQELIKNSLFSLVLDGDCHWSYRLTEVVNMGSIPVIVVEDDWTNIPFSNLLDYTDFSILVHKNKISSLKHTLENIPQDRVSTLKGNLKLANDGYFSSRDKQVQALLDFMSSVYPDLPVPKQQ